MNNIRVCWTLNMFSPILTVLAIVSAIISTINMGGVSSELFGKARMDSFIFCAIYAFGIMGLMDRGDDDANFIGAISILAASVFIFIKSNKALGSSAQSDVAIKSDKVSGWHE